MQVFLQQDGQVLYMLENGTLMYQKEWQNIKDRQSFLEL